MPLPLLLHSSLGSSSAPTVLAKQSDWRKKLLPSTIFSLQFRINFPLSSFYIYSFAHSNRYRLQFYFPFYAITTNSSFFSLALPFIFFGKFPSLCEDAIIFDAENTRKNVKVSIIIYDLVVFRTFFWRVWNRLGGKGIKYRHLTIIPDEVIEGKRTFAFILAPKSDHNVSSTINLLFIVVY